MKRLLFIIFLTIYDFISMTNNDHNYVCKPQLQAYKGKICSIALTNGEIVTGTLNDYDGFLNLTLNNGQDSKGNKFNSAVIRGNSIVTIK